MGTTNHLPIREGQLPVYPHTRGDYAFVSSLVFILFGLPPHAWGLLYRSVAEASPLRSTPTRVGTTLTYSSVSLSCAVYPHTRGDYNTQYCITTGTGGLPPHAWGLPIMFMPPPTLSRSTPTRVGTTRNSHCRPIASAVYPHTRGDYYRQTEEICGFYGLPPHAWGLRLAVVYGLGLGGLPPHAWGLRNQNL